MRKYIIVYEKWTKAGIIKITNANSYTIFNFGVSVITIDGFIPVNPSNDYEVNGNENEITSQHIQLTFSSTNPANNNAIVAIKLYV